MRTISNLLVFGFLMAWLCAFSVQPVDAQPTDPGINSSIKKVYVISQTHVDIGFDYPPEEMRLRNAQWIDAQIAYARSRPTFRYTIEHTWMFENWRNLASPAQIEEMIGLLRSGRFELGAAHSTLHSGKAGVEEVNRLLWNAQRLRDQFGVPIDTMLFNDVPGVAWSYPQVLAKSGVRFLVCGMNMFIGGGFTQPYASYPFYWQGPDGSKILVWATQHAYVEGWATWEPSKISYGIPFGTNNPNASINKSYLEAALKELTDKGYPYDAVLVMHSADARISNNEHNAAIKWNNTYQNPQIITATPREFFEYFEPKYKNQIPTHSGNWTTRWDTGQIMEPQTEKIVKNAQNQVPATEQAWAIASSLNRGSYPHALFDTAWDMMLTEDEHAGAGGGWANYFTQAQVDIANQQYWDYALACLNATTQTMESARAALLGATARPSQDTIAVFNSLSWARTDLVRLKASPSLFAADFRVLDSVTSAVVPHQKDSRTSEILFVAPQVPPMGYKRFLVSYTAPPASSTSLVVAANSVENSRYRLQVNANGTVSSILDKAASQEMVDTASSFKFNAAVKATNQQYFFGQTAAIPAAASTIISQGLAGPVAASLRIENANHPVAASEYVLFEGLDRLEIINTVDRTQMEYAPLAVNSIYMGFTFPFNVPGYTTSSIDTAAGWLAPKRDSIAGSYTNAHAIQNGINVSGPTYGVNFSTPDVYVHAFSGFQTSGGYSPPAKPTIVSSFIRYVDESDIKNSDLPGYVIVEPGSSPHWNLRYAIRSQQRALDPVADARFGSEVCTPFLAAFVPMAPAGPLAANQQSFFKIDAGNVLITSVKKADFGGDGIIVKMQEVAGQPALVQLDSPFFALNGAFLCSPLEANLSSLPVSGKRYISMPIKPREILSLRLILPGMTGVPSGGWAIYD